MSASVPSPESAKASPWHAHPLVVSVITPVVVAVVFGAGSVWVTQASILWRVGTIESRVEADKQDREKQVQEIKSEIVPRAEHEAYWKGTNDKLDLLRQQGAHTNERVDKIYDLMIGRPR